MSITDELREFVERHLYLGATARKEGVLEIADRIDAEHEKAIRELNNLSDASTLLPVDADGEIIHVGDMMERGKARGHVIALMLSEYPKKWGGGLHWSIQLEGEQAPTALDAFFRHRHKPTVEDLLRKFFKETGDGLHTLEAVDTQVIIAKYAAKLCLADDVLEER